MPAAVPARVPKIRDSRRVYAPSTPRLDPFTPRFDPFTPRFDRFTPRLGPFRPVYARPFYAGSIILVRNIPAISQVERWGRQRVTLTRNCILTPTLQGQSTAIRPTFTGHLGD